MVIVLILMPIVMIIMILDIHTEYMVMSMPLMKLWYVRITDITISISKVPITTSTQTLVVIIIQQWLLLIQVSNIALMEGTTITLIMILAITIESLSTITIIDLTFMSTLLLMSTIVIP